jgi:hypothetical protein
MRGVGPFFYCSKVEHHLEARLWNSIFTWTETRLGLKKVQVWRSRWRQATFHVVVPDFSLSTTSHSDRERHFLPWLLILPYFLSDHLCPFPYSSSRPFELRTG